MADFFKAILLGIIQGATEFLPVSSSGHLLIFERIIGYDGSSYGAGFELMLHFGTLVAACVALRSEIIYIIKEDRRKILLLLFATLPAALIGLLFSGAIEQIFFANITLLPIFFIMTAILLFISGEKRGVKDIDKKSALLVGLTQAVCVIPGLSRSGATVSVARLLGVKTERAIAFSFLLSIPIIMGGVLLGAIKGAICFDLPSVAATIAAALSGFISVKFAVNLFSKYKFFCAYLIILSAILTILCVLGVL